jgi:hypothetical protein
MTNVLRWAVVAVLVGHGYHLLGVAKGFGWAEIPQLKQPMGVSGGILWLLAAVYVIASAVLMAVGAPPWWWLIAACGAVVSQAAIVTSWTDDRRGQQLNCDRQNGTALTAPSRRTLPAVDTVDRCVTRVKRLGSVGSTATSRWPAPGATRPLLLGDRCEEEVLAGGHHRRDTSTRRAPGSVEKRDAGRALR